MEIVMAGGDTAKARHQAIVSSMTVSWRVPSYVASLYVDSAKR